MYKKPKHGYHRAISMARNMKVTFNNKKVIDKITKLFAIFFIIATILLIIFSFIYINKATLLINISSVLATLVGAILVFSTLEIQSKSLYEEIRKNKISRYDSRFYPILSSFRMDAANMEIVRDYIIQKGNDYGQENSLSYKGDTAFLRANEIIVTLKKCILDESLKEYDSEYLFISLQDISEKENAINEYSDSFADDIDKIEQERHYLLHSQQGPYLLYKYNITKDDRQKYRNTNEEQINSFLLNKLVEKQPTILTKYINTLRFILQLIDGISKEIDRKDYYQNLYCLFGKEEIQFLKQFKEFDLVTNY